jgi:hypothetical protein
MEGAHDPLRRRCFKSIAFGLAVLASGCGRTDVNAPAGREGAQMLVERYARQIGAAHRMLDPAGDISFGSTGFTYDAARDLLVGRVFINHVLIDDAPPEELANYRKVAVALNDPQIGGMFDRGGGVFFLDEGRQGIYLVRSFHVAETTPDALFAAMEALQDVAAIWTTKWLYRVSMIAHGNQPAPKQPVTRANPD